MDLKTTTMAEDILACFFFECRNRFRFLEYECGFRAFGGMVECRNNNKIIRPYEQKASCENLPALVRYERGTQVFEITYGRDAHTLESFVYPGRVSRLSLREFFAACRIDSAGVENVAGIRTAERLIERLKMMACDLAAHQSILTEFNAEDLDRALAARQKRVEQAVRARYEEDMRQAAKIAARAYRRQEYMEVIRLLKPYEKHLGGADRKKYSLARKKLIEPFITS